MKYYMDCEFDGLDGPLLSMAIVAETGKSMYAILNRTICDPWVLANVRPILFAVPIEQIQFCHLGCSDRQLSILLEDFFRGDEHPYVVADWPDDIKYLSAALITGPGTMINVPEMKFGVRRVDAYPTTLQGANQHNAWWDAMALRHMFVREAMVQS